MLSKKVEEAISKNMVPTLCIFFENKDGIHFKTLQELYEQPISGEYHSGDKGSDEEYTSQQDSGKIAQSLKRMLDYSLN